MNQGDITMRQDESGVIAGEMALVAVAGVFVTMAAAPLLLLLIVRAIQLSVVVLVVIVLALQATYRLVVPERPAVDRWAAQPAYAAREARKRAKKRERERKAVVGSRRALDDKSAFGQLAATVPHPYGISAFARASK
jgi:hypothetical protein